MKIPNSFSISFLFFVSLVFAVFVAWAIDHPRLQMQIQKPETHIQMLEFAAAVAKSKAYEGKLDEERRGGPLSFKELEKELLESMKK